MSSEESEVLAMDDITKYSQHVQSRYRECLANGKTYRIDRFWHYVKLVEQSNRNVETCSHEELLEEYESALADSSRYSRPPLYTGEDERLSECNFIIMALAGDRHDVVRTEILRRMNLNSGGKKK